MSRSWRIQTFFWRSSTVRMSSMLSMSSMTIAGPFSVLRGEVEQVSDEDEPEESEAGERKKGCIEFVPDCPVFTAPGIDCVINDHHGPHGTENTDDLSEVNPFIQAVVESRDVRQNIEHDPGNTGD